MHKSNLHHNSHTELTIVMLWQLELRLTTLSHHYASELANFEMGGWRGGGLEGRGAGGEGGWRGGGLEWRGELLPPYSALIGTGDEANSAHKTALEIFH